MVMSLEDAIRWAVMGSRRVNLEDMYPGLPTDTERKQAWVDDNRDSIREAMTVLMVAWPDDFPSGASLDSTGSMFEMSMQNFFIPVYWKPAAIQVEYEAFEYAVSTPHHVDALYAMHDKDTAFEYLQTHYDARAPVHPRQLIVHPGWDPLTQFPPPSPLPRSAFLKGRIRYTLSDWRKRRVHHTAPDLLAVQRYYLENYDLKEFLDAEGHVVGSEQGPKYVPGSERGENHVPESISRL